MRTIQLFLLSVAICANVFAQNIKIVGTIEKTLKLPANTSLKTPSINQPIKLLKIQLSKSAQQVLNKRSAAILNHRNTLINPANLPSKVELGMNNVPVLNQGPFGTCVTFAATAAVDAASGKGDYVSQVCQLQLGLYLQNNGYGPSGWNGTFGRVVLGQMELFGIVSKEQQRTVGCGELTEYPENQDSDPGREMSLEQFHKISENLENNAVDWSPILDIYNSVLNRTDTNIAINDIKAALNEHDRVTFGVLMLDFELGLMGAVGSHNATFDTWVLTPEIARDIYLRPNFGAHEMIITGYDDNAVATDELGRQYKGLFTLRNSWGDTVGDKGDFYMSYDYLRVLILEAQRIRNMPENVDDSESTKP